MLSRQTVFAAKVETTTGTPISLSATDGVFNAYNAKIKATIPRNQRPGQGTSFGQLPQVPGARMGELTVETDLAGPSTDPTVTTLWTAAGFANATGTLTPSSGSASYVTVTTGVYQDGRLKTIAGAVADLVIRGSSGGPCRMFWKLNGVWQAPSATALITPTYPTTVTPRLAAATFTIASTSYNNSDFELSLNNVLTPRLDGTNASGYFAYCISNSDYQFKCNLEAATAKDFYADHLAGTEVALNLVIGATAGNIITITAPKMQLLDPPDDNDANGVIQDALTFQLNRSAAAGDDMLQVVYS
jgi:hypothetical protein